jgi:hypothetical protein
MTISKAEIDRAMRVLVGKALWKCTRAGDMACFDFGALRTVPAFGGGTKEAGEYALHVQCPWRITQEGRFIVGSGDLHYPANHESGREIPAKFDCDRDPNLRDKLLSQMFEKQQTLVVREVCAAAAGAVNILLTDGIALDIFPHDSDGEWWRLFEPGENTRHFVAGAAAGQSDDT